MGNILKMHNIPCVIFEKNENISEYGAGISISPNGLKVLEYLEVLESFNEISRQPIEATFFSNEKKLIKIPVNVSTATRKNLYKVLFNKYLSMGGNVIFDHEVSSIIRYSTSNPSINKCLSIRYSIVLTINYMNFHSFVQ